MIPPYRKRPLETILKKMHPKLVDIVGRIHGVGIQEESDLVDAMKWPEGVKEEFFREKAGLNLFQYTLLKVGVEKELM